MDQIALRSEYQSIVLRIRAYVEPILNYLPRGIPNYPDHGTLHSNNLLKLLLNFVRNFDQFSFSQEEKLLLSLAIHLHDIGCILGRTQHNRKTVKLLGHTRFGFLEDMIGKDLLDCLKYLILAHSSDYRLERVPEQPIHANVRLRLLCSVFRLLDGCEISSARVSRVLYDILTTHSKISAKNAKYWAVHLSIVAIIFRGNEIIVDSNNLGKTRMLTKHLENDLDKINKVFEEEGFPQLSLRVIKLKYE